MKTHIVHLYVLCNLYFCDSSCCLAWLYTLSLFCTIPNPCPVEKQIDLLREDKINGLIMLHHNKQLTNSVAVW